MKKIGFIGAGNLTSALVHGSYNKGVSSQLYVYDHHREKAIQLKQLYKSQEVGTIQSLLTEVDIVVLAIKPQQMNELLKEILPYIQPTHILVSVAAGKTMSSLQDQLTYPVAIVRVMTNTATHFNLGMTAICFNELIHEDIKAELKEFFLYLGQVIELPEHMFNAFTALGGSGPGFMYYFMEGLEKAGIGAGFSPEEAHQVVSQMALGAVQMVTGGESLENLRKKVTSKGGTTEAGIQVMNENKLQDIVQTAIDAAIKKAQKLG